MRFSQLLLFTFYFLLFTLFFQTRFAFFARYQTVDYLIPFVYFSDILIVLLLLRSLKSFRLLKFLRSFRNKRSIFQFFSFSVFLFSTAISNFSAIHPVSAWYHWFKILELGLFAFWVGWFVQDKREKTCPPFASRRRSRRGKEKKIYHLSVRHQLSVSGGLADGPFTIYHLLSIGLVFQCLIAIGEFILQRSLGLQIFGEWRFSVLTPGIAKVILFGKEFLRPYATFPHPNVLGGILAIMAPVNFYLAFARKSEIRNPKLQTNPKSEILNSKKEFLLFTFYFLLFTLTLFLTFSRSAWLAYIVLIFFVLFYWGWRIRGFKKFRELKRWIVPVLLFALCSLLFIAPIVYQRIKSLQTTDVLSVERRVELANAAISMFWDHPLFGVGLGNFVPNLEKYLIVSGQGRFLQPVHNVPLLILAETGIAGFLAFLLFLGIILYSFLRSGKFSIFPPCRRAGNFQFSILLMWLGILIISLFDHYFWTLQVGQLFFWLTVGLTI